MKAIILDSGIGNRMGEFTQTHHKSMAVLKNGETIFERQLRVLRACGVRDFVVTTGPFADQLQDKAAQPQFADCRFTWVPNPVYRDTNYIYSLYLARGFLDEDCLLLHGDLVFSTAFLRSLLADPRPSLGTVQPNEPLPEKDFKARVIDGRIRKVSVKIFGDDCMAFQPMYKLSHALLERWMDRIGDFVEAKNTGVYAEEALNELLDEGLVLEPFDCGPDFIGEVDNLDDLDHAGSAIRLCDFRNQQIIDQPDGITAAADFLREYRLGRLLLVAGRSLDRQPFGARLLELPAEFVRFSAFTANPDLEEVMAATELYRGSGCEGVVAVGGGSALDIAKCVKLYAAQPEGTALLTGPYACTHIPMLAIPTTAGTGSESTHFSVVYVDGVKHSIQHDSMLPETVILLPEALATLPEYQKKSTLLDAVCHGVESMWSVRATEQSRAYAEQGLLLLLGNMDAYLAGDAEAAEAVMRGANLCGRAINLSQTTAGHAMSYILTKKLRISHGHAASLCLRALVPFMFDRYRRQPDDPSFHPGFAGALKRLEAPFGADSTEALEKRLLSVLGILDAPDTAGLACEADELASSVNAQRLANHPMKLTDGELKQLYQAIIEKESVAKNG